MDFEVGCRIVDLDGFRGTVRYIGPVAVAKNPEEIWLGIEWDNGDRGKHDGSCVDSSGILHRYFYCIDGAGSFVKKDTGKVSCGRSFVTALQERYVAMDAPEVAPDCIIPDAFVLTASGKQKNVELIGEKQIRKWQQIQTISKITMRSDTVSSCGADTADVASHLEEVDLQDNLIWKWAEVADFGRQLPALRTLLLHGNRMQPVTKEIVRSLAGDSFSSLRVLALNGCNIQSWAAVSLLEPFLSNLEHLFLSGNNFSDLPEYCPGDGVESFQSSIESNSAEGLSIEGIHISVEGTAEANVESSRTTRTDDRELSPVKSCQQSESQGLAQATNTLVSGFQHLQTLDLSNCQISDWKQIFRFGALPSLQELQLDNNPISVVLRCPSNGVSTERESSLIDWFSSLQRLSLSSTRISCWSDIDSLATYSKLNFLRLSHIPLFSGKGASEVRPVIIGRMAKLRVFNGSQISERERIDSEKIYLRRAMKELSEAIATAALGPVPVPAVAHPRYAELAQTYATELLPMGRGATEASGSISSELVSVTLRNLSFVSGGSLEPVQRRLPLSLTVSKLKSMVRQLFGLEVGLQQLSMRPYSDSVPVVLDDDESTLRYFGAIDGAEIFINEAKA